MRSIGLESSSASSVCVVACGATGRRGLRRRAARPGRRDRGRSSRRSSAWWSRPRAWAGDFALARGWADPLADVDRRRRDWPSPADRRVRRARSTLPPITARVAATSTSPPPTTSCTRSSAAAARRAGGLRPQDRLHQPHDLAALRRVPADVGAHVGAHGASRADGRATLSLAGFVQPRIEPEVVFGLRAPSRSTDDARAMLAASSGSRRASRSCKAIFRTGSSPRPIAPRRSACTARSSSGRGRRSTTRDRDAIAAALPLFELTLRRGERVVDRGVGANVLDSPALALRHLAQVLAAQPQFPPLAAGEIVTTGTITDAWPVAPARRGAATTARWAFPASDHVHLMLPVVGRVTAPAARVPRPPRRPRSAAGRPDYRVERIARDERERRHGVSRGMSSVRKSATIRRARESAGCAPSRPRRRAVTGGDALQEAEVRVAMRRRSRCCPAAPGSAEPSRCPGPNASVRPVAPASTSTSASCPGARAAPPGCVSAHGHGFTGAPVACVRVHADCSSACASCAFA